MRSHFYKQNEQGQGNDNAYGDPRLIRDQSIPIGQQFKKFGPVFIIIVAIVLIVAAYGVYNLSKFFITWAAQSGAPEFINTSNVPTWIVTVLLVVLVLGLLRSATTYLANIVKFVFKIAQSDIVTIILAVVVNALLLFLNGWITTTVIGWINLTNVDNFFNNGGFLALATMFCMLACSLVWVPRIGVYGENRLGQFDDDGR